MKRTTVRHLLICGMLTFLTSGVCAYGDGLASAKQKYRDAEAEIGRQLAEEKGKAISAYRAALARTIEGLRTAGELDAYLASKKELERMDRDGSVPQTSPSSLPAAVLRLQSQCRTSLTEADRAILGRRIRLAEQYVAHLKGLVKSYMAEDGIEEAKNASEEQKRAEFILADLSSQVPRPRAEGRSDGPVAEPRVDAFTLILHIKTGGRKNDGTGSPVYVGINDDPALTRRVPEQLRAGAEQKFEFEFESAAADIQSITIRIGGGDAWRPQEFGFAVLHGNQRTDTTWVKGGYFSSEREGGPTVAKKTYAFAPRFDTPADDPRESMTSSSEASRQALKDSVVLHYAFDVSARLGADSGVHGHHGKPQKGTGKAAGRRAGACSFDGEQGCIEILSASDGLGAKFRRDFAIACWVKPYSLKGRGTIVSIEGTSRYVQSGFEGFTLELNNGLPRVFVAYADTLRNEASAQARLRQRGWMHIVVSRREDTLTFFIDGKEDSQHAVSADDIKYGSRYPGYDAVGILHDSHFGKSFPFKGYLDELLLINRAVSKDEATTLYRGSW